jgi:hypothetical protein
MTTLREAAQQALEALEYYEHRKLDWCYADEAAITALRAALEQQVQEPGFWGRVAARQSDKIKQLETDLRAALKQPGQEPVAERLRLAGLTLIGLAEHDQNCDVFDLDDDGKHKPCSCGFNDAYAAIREAGKSAITPDGKLEREHSPDCALLKIPSRDCDCQPEPPPEAQTKAEQVAYCAGWWAAMAAKAKEQPEQDWEDLYRKEKARADMWRDKYESLAGPDERVYPQQEQEPVAWLRKNGFRFSADLEPQDDSELPLYTHPPRRAWQGLTDEEVDQMAGNTVDAWECARAVEAALKERNA